MTDTVVAEGQVKFRDGKKWKTRWVVLRKPSPVADCLSLLVYKEKKKGKEKGSGHKERLNVTLEGICGVEPGPGYDGVSYTLTILCLAHTLVLGFNSRDALLAWDARIRYGLGEVHRFSVNVEPGTKLESGPASLHLCNNVLVLTRGAPPVVVGHWKLSALRRYGAVPNGFVFEGGTRCGYWAGVFFLSCSDGEQISFLFDCIVRGITPSRTPHGLRPALPDLNADPVSAEERISQEASELEKRLSMLSTCSLASSTASTYSCSTSVAGDDQSSISSSSSSQSEASYGGRLPYWVEPLARQHLSNEMASSSSTLKALTSSDDRLYAAVMGSSRTRPSSAQLHSRGLNDSGRQSSLDSGIGIAAGSQSSYSGSVSSCTGSLDMAGQGGGEEFGSVGSLPAPPPTAPSSVPPLTPPPPPPPPFPTTLTLEQSPATSASCPCPSRPSSCTSWRHSDEYRVPSVLRLQYDVPRSLLHTLSRRELSTEEEPPEPGRGIWSEVVGECDQRLSISPAGARAQAMMQRSYSWGSEIAPSVDSEGRSTPRASLVPGSSVWEETQCSPGLDNYITPEQWRTVRNRCLTQVSSPADPSPAHRQGLPPRCMREECDDIGEAADKRESLKWSVPSPPPSDPPPPPPLPPVGLSTHRPTSACGTFQSAHPSASLNTGHHSDSTVNYVNIPINPLLAKPNRVLHYTELDLLEHGLPPVSSPYSALREEGSVRYAHLDIAAMETAQRVGAEHAQGREDRLTQLENRRQGSTQLTLQRPSP